ncbi:MAG: TonB-dependent receptor [Bacteroidetes bacterium]|nr:TonB-dependent receptor [Bacteroidota bacterium]
MLKTTLLLFSFLLVTSATFSQPSRGGGFGGTISGTVIDNDDSKPLEYTNVVLFKSETKEMFTGTVSDPSGRFNLEKILPGSYYLEIKYIGYEMTLIESLKIGRNSRNIDIGTVKLNKAAYDVGEVEVVAEQSFVEYKIDKKVINVSKQATSLSGTAIDALQISPSVRVDIDGTVSLRGSTSFTLLIDSKPTVLDASSALEQIPASAIENIEIITNPSAKYDPDGTSGIINVILKKNELSGLSGMVNLNGGTYDNYGGDAKFEYRHNGLTTSFGINYASRNRPGSSTSYRETTSNNIISSLNSDGSRERGGNMFGLQGGISFDFTDSDNVSASIDYGRRDFGSTSGLIYEEWSSLNPIHLFYSSEEDNSMEGDFYRGNLNFTHKFPGVDHKLYLELNYSYRDMDHLSNNDLFDDNNVLTDSKKYIEGGPGRNLRIKAEYKLPLNEKDYIETGYQGRLDYDDEFNNNYQFNPATDEYDFLNLYSHDSKSKDNIHALFFTYAAQPGAFGYQLGLRGEYTDRNIELVGENQNFRVDRTDLFPTVHTSYSFDDTFQLMASYSRRIERPRGYYLEPFFTFEDAYNVRTGNPDLEPEFINSFELGMQKHFEMATISLESYYRNTVNKIERVRSVYSENVMLQTFANVGESHALGIEMMLTLNPVKFWNLNLTGDLYDYKEEGNLLGLDYSSTSFNYSFRMNNRLMFTKTIGAQLDFHYDSPSVSAQGKHDGHFSMNAAATYQIIPKVLTAILQIRDVFSTMKFKSDSYGPGFYNITERERKSPMISLTVRYSINNYQQERMQERNGADDGGGDSEEGLN